MRRPSNRESSYARAWRARSATRPRRRAAALRERGRFSKRPGCGAADFSIATLHREPIEQEQRKRRAFGGAPGRLSMRARPVHFPDHCAEKQDGDVVGIAPSDLACSLSCANLRGDRLKQARHPRLRSADCAVVFPFAERERAAGRHVARKFHFSHTMRFNVSNTEASLCGSSARVMHAPSPAADASGAARSGPAWASRAAFSLSRRSFPLSANCQTPVPPSPRRQPLSALAADFVASPLRAFVIGRDGLRGIASGCAP